MSQQQQPQRPVTFGDVFPVSGALASQPVTKEDAALMQRTETLTFGHTQKGGATATMLSAADHNVQSRIIPKDAPTSVANDGVTYADVLSVIGALDLQPNITNEDAALMQHAEAALRIGHTQKGETASAMQSTTADQKMQAQAVPTDAHSSVATYGDFFAVTGALATQPITKEDAALMQRAETLALGHTQKGGAVATMQSAADHNVQSHAIPEDAHSSVADEGITVVTTILPKDTVQTYFVAGQPISSSAQHTSMVPAVAGNLQDAVTIGEALEAAAVHGGDEAIEPSDASAIQSAEKRATRGIPTMPGGLAATAQAAAELNPRVEDFAKTTLADVLMDATIMLPNKVVTWEDAEKVAEAELRHKQTNELREGGVAAALVSAAEHNDKVGLAPSSQMEQLKVE